MRSDLSLLERLTPELSKIKPAEDKVTYPNIGPNRGINSQATPNNGTFEPISVQKKKGPLIIHDKRWYFRLVSDKSNEKYKRARALMDDYTINDISRHLVICFTPDILPGNIKPFRNKEGNIIRIYAYFDSYLEFYDYMIKFPEKERAFYEIIFGELPQKPHFDIDINANDLNTAYPGEDIDVVAETLKEAVITGCREVLDDSLDLSRDLLLYSSHGKSNEVRSTGGDYVSFSKMIEDHPTGSNDVRFGKDKRSFHIVLNNKCHNGNKEAKVFYDAVIKKIQTYTQGKYLDFVDKSVYSPRQQFRIKGCCKHGSDRIKIFHEQFIYQGQSYTHVYAEDVSDPVMKERADMYESLASFTSGCDFLPSLIPPKQIVLTNNNTDMLDLEDDTVNRCMSMLHDKIRNHPFSITEVNGNMILLKRNAPSHCLLCHRIHEHENPYIFIVGGKVYWDCRRSNESKKLFLGCLGITISEMEKGVRLPHLDYMEDSNEDTEEDNQGEKLMLGDYPMGSPLKKESGESPQSSPISQNHSLSSKNIQQQKVDIPVEQRIQNVPQYTSRIAKERADRKSSNHTPGDLVTRCSLNNVRDQMEWDGYNHFR